MKMRALLSLGLSLLLVAGSVPVYAQANTWAKPRDVRVLRDELAALDYALDELHRRQPPHARTADFDRRAEDLRGEVTGLSDRMRRRTGDNTGVMLDDITQLRREISDLRLDIENTLELRYSGASAVLPSGTDVVIRLDQTVSSRSARPEDRVTATVAEPVRLDGRIVIPVGAEVSGVVRSVDSADRLSRGGKLELAFDTVRVDNQRLEMRTRIMEVKEGVDKSEAQKKAGLGAIIGGVLGGIMDGRSGAIVGAILGAGGGVAASKGEDVVLPEGTLMTLRLDDAMTVTR